MFIVPLTSSITPMETMSQKKQTESTDDSNRVNIVLLWIIYEYGRNKEKRSVWKMIAKNHLGI